MKKVLFVGETCTNTVICIKGYDSFSSSYYEESFQDIKKAIENAGYEFTNIGCHEVDAKFPSTCAALSEYDCLILSDVGSNSFYLRNETYHDSIICADRLQIIRQYVEEGGAFLMIGGYVSFNGIGGIANYGHTPIQDILPVLCIDGDDRRECPSGGIIRCAQNHEAIADFPAEWPPVLGYNKTIPKEGCDVPVTVNEDPLLVFGSFGKGRTAAFTSDCTHHWAPPAFTQWEYYDKLWKGILDYLTR